MSKQYIIPIVVPYLEDITNCIFCKPESITDQTKQITGEDVKNIIEEYLNSFKDTNVKKEVAFFGGSFTAIEKEKQEELLESAYQYIKAKKIDSIRISTRPDCINKTILKRLKKYKVKTIELGVQSANDYVLERAGRSHKFEDVKKASKLIRKYRFNLGHQIMVGLPESTWTDEIETAKKLVKLKPKMLRIYPVLVMKNTKLEKEYNENKYQSLNVVKAVEICKEIVKIFDKKGVKIIRIGLQNTDLISELENLSSEVVAGPYHIAFGQLVESALWYDVIIQQIKKINSKVKKATITVNPVDVNNIIGYKKENVEKIKQLYDVEIKVIANKKIKQGKFVLTI